MIKRTSISILLIFLLGCSNSGEEFSADKKTSKLEFYENITGIKFPKQSKVISVVDSDFCSVAIIDFDRSYCNQFYSYNNFRSINVKFTQTLLRQLYLDSVYRQLPDNSKLLRRRGKGNGTLWMYLLDTTTSRLYCNFSYPDNNGYTKPIWNDPFQEHLSPNKEKFSK